MLSEYKEDLLITEQDLNRALYGHAFIEDGRVRDLFWAFAEEVLFRLLRLFEVVFCLWWLAII